MTSLVFLVCEDIVGYKVSKIYDYEKQIIKKGSRKGFCSKFVITGVEFRRLHT